MKRFFTFLFAVTVVLTSSTTATAQTVTVPYNPDGDANGLIGVTDLQDLLSTYGGAFAPGAIVVDSIELGEVLASLQAQISAFRCGDNVLHEGYWYNTTAIGGQCWFAENVRYLPEVSPSTAASGGQYPDAYVYGYQGTDVSEAQNTLEYHQFGALYNFPAVEQWNLCPEGWHVPTDLEWTEMTNSLGSENYAGNLMKMKFGDDWDGTNLRGFSGLPGGYRTFNGYFDFAGFSGYWWSSSLDSLAGNGDVWYRSLSVNAEVVDRDSYGARYGFSVRCVRDAE